MVYRVCGRKRTSPSRISFTACRISALSSVFMTVFYSVFNPMTLFIFLVFTYLGFANLVQGNFETYFCTPKTTNSFCNTSITRLFTKSESNTDILQLAVVDFCWIGHYSSTDSTILFLFREVPIVQCLFFSLEKPDLFLPKICPFSKIIQAFGLK